MVLVVLTCILYSVFSFSTMSFGVTVVKVRGKCRAINNIIYGKLYCTVCCTVYISSIKLGNSPPSQRHWTTWCHRGVNGNSHKNQTEEEEGRTERQLSALHPGFDPPSTTGLFTSRSVSAGPISHACLKEPCGKLRHTWLIIVVFHLFV